MTNSSAPHTRVTRRDWIAFAAIGAAGAVAALLAVPHIAVLISTGRFLAADLSDIVAGMWELLSG